MNDSWCKKVRASTGNIVSGGAARNVRIAAAGGMDEILEDAVAAGTRAGVHHAMARMQEAMRETQSMPTRGSHTARPSGVSRRPLQ